MSNQNSLSSTSRYHDIETTSLKTADGKELVYLKRRLVPPAERFALLQEHIIGQGDRLDVLTAMYFNDAQQFWRICDANNAMNPSDLTAEPGRKLRISLPEGIPELFNATE